MRRWLAGIATFIVLLSVAAWLHAYLVQRMVVDANLDNPWRVVSTGLIWTGFGAMLLQPLADRFLPRSWGRLLSMPGASWMALVFWLLLALGVTDIALLAIAHAPGTVGPWRAAAVAIAVAALASVGHYNVRRGPRDVRLEIALQRWPTELDGYRIVQISDIHIGPTLDRRFARRLVERVNALEPDLVAVTGDLVDGRLEHLIEEVQPFGDLQGRDGVFFVTGNHDFYSGADAWTDHLTTLGLRVLRNESEIITRGPSAFGLAGVDDHRGGLLPGDGGEDLDAALAGLPEALPIILLAHDPSTFKASHARGIDLQLSGHTHGGQIWPFHALVRLVIPFVAGRYSRGGAELYVSRGTGFWGPPMRLGAPAEITEIVVRSAPQPSHAPTGDPR